MRRLQEDLWQCTLYSMGVLNTHAYFLRRPGGNVLFYNTSNPDDLDDIEGLGGIRYQLLTHRDEASPSLNDIRDRFGSQLCFGALEVQAIDRYASPDMTFGPDDQNLDDIKIIHTPGHTEGSVCYFYESPHGKSYLFTGDTIFQSNGQWSTFVIPQFGGSIESLARSLLRLGNLRPDIVMSSGFVGNVSFREITGDEWADVIDGIIKQLA